MCEVLRGASSARTCAVVPGPPNLRWVVSEVEAHIERLLAKRAKTVEAIGSDAAWKRIDDPTFDCGSSFCHQRTNYVASRGGRDIESATAYWLRGSVHDKSLIKGFCRLLSGHCQGM
jgi:hypothetical protein